MRGRISNDQNGAIQLDDATVLGIEVKLPKTNLVVITTSKGYIMCGALDIGLLNSRLQDRGIVAGRATVFAHG